LFFGAPLVAGEVEHGTHRLVWTQGVSRRHWAVVKVGVVSAAAVAVGIIWPKVLPAMAATLAGYAGLRYAAPMAG
jgi:hypothetical protein